MSSAAVKKICAFYKAVGCDRCQHTGYSGRIGIYELVEIDDSLRNAIHHRADAAEITEIAKKNGMKTMFEDGLAKALLGNIDLSELLKVTYE